MTDTEFDDILAEIMDENKASSLLSIPGVYEIVSEHFNNDVLTKWEVKALVGNHTKGNSK